MNLESLTFVALDLETTGLDTTRDRIIEVAAVRFRLEWDGSAFIAKDFEERSMLIDPGVIITDEISMITGISNDMVRGKPRWEEVRERVATFIGKNSVIVGHNVLFDIEVFRNHGINLESTILDTFELSEILAQDAESLNLGFLSNRYGISLPGEHRALTDVKMSIGLFVKFLTDIRNLDNQKLGIFVSIAEHDDTRMMRMIVEICEISHPPYILESFSIREEKSPAIEPGGSNQYDPQSFGITSLGGSTNEEIELIGSYAEKYKKIYLMLHGKKQKEWIRSELETVGLQIGERRSINSYISTDRIAYRLGQSKSWPRKYTILIAKLLFWLETTSTGLLSELKYYGDEYEMLEEFRETSAVQNHFFQQSIEKNEGANIVLLDTYEFFRDKDIGQYALPYYFSLIREIEGLEDVVRGARTQEFSFGRLYALLGKIKHTRGGAPIGVMLGNLEMIEGLTTSIVPRPMGDEPFPPGNYGETYHLTQDALWHRGGQWFPILLRSVSSLWEEIYTTLTEEDKKEYCIEIKYIDTSLSLLRTILCIKNQNISIILHIQNGKSSLQVVPREVRSLIERFIAESEGRVAAYGNSISGPIMKGFIERETVSSVSWQDENIRPKKSHFVIDDLLNLEKNIEQGFTETGDTLGVHIILTTSLKQAKELGSILKNIYTKKNIPIFIQGLSGGKSKILANILKTEGSSILVGLIDSWTDEFSIWENAHSIHISKLPFDPPTDVRFLARTVGMKDNFAMYSIPITIKKMNTLLTRICQGGFQKTIFCYDVRLTDTLWGKEILREII